MWLALMSASVDAMQYIPFFWKSLKKNKVYRKRVFNLNALLAEQLAATIHIASEK